MTPAAESGLCQAHPLDLRYNLFPSPPTRVAPRGASEREVTGMALKYLIGPVSGEQARNWTGPRQQGHCRAFNAVGTVDLAIGPADTWDDVCRRLPAGWR